MGTRRSAIRWAQSKSGLEPDGARRKRHLVMVPLLQHARQLSTRVPQSHPGLRVALSRYEQRSCVGLSTPGGLCFAVMGALAWMASEKRKPSSPQDQQEKLTPLEGRCTTSSGSPFHAEYNSLFSGMLCLRMAAVPGPASSELQKGRVYQQSSRMTPRFQLVG